MVIELLVGVLFLLGFVLTAVYLFYVRRVQRLLEMWLPEYWQSIGSPRGFSVHDAKSIFSSLYTSDMGNMMSRINSRAELIVVRVLLPVCTVINLLVISLIIIGNR